MRRLPAAADLDGFTHRTIWIPQIHPSGTDLAVAALERHGYTARSLPDEDAESFEIGRRVTRGSECLPTALTIGRFLQTLAAEGGTGRHALFMPTTQGPCRFGQYCTLHRQILDREGYTDVAILSPSSYNAYAGLDRPVRQTIWQAIVLADLMTKAACKARPYETCPGDVDSVLAAEMRRLASAMVNGGDLDGALRHAVDRVASASTAPRQRRPVVGIVGEVFVRNNRFASEDVIHAVERFGGEAWMAPTGEWMQWIASTANQNSQPRPPSLLPIPPLGTLATSWWMRYWERRLLKAAGPYLADRHEPSVESVVEGAREWMAVNVGGEAVLTIGRTMVFGRQGAAAVVNCSPFGCMPGTVSAAVFRQLSIDLGMPIVSMFYDGNGGENRKLEAILQAAFAAGPSL